MDRTQHPSNNAVLGAPKGWNQAEMPCNALPITRTDIDGRPAIVSFWRPTAEELQQLASGAFVALWIVGASMPPVSLTVEP